MRCTVFGQVFSQLQLLYAFVGAVEAGTLGSDCINMGFGRPRAAPVPAGLIHVGVAVPVFSRRAARVRQELIFNPRYEDVGFLLVSSSRAETTFPLTLTSASLSLWVHSFPLWEALFRALPSAAVEERGAMTARR